MARTSASSDSSAYRFIDPAQGRSSLAPGRALSWGTGLALLFLMSALLALALWPAYVGRDVAQIGQQITDVLEPAQDLVSRVEFAQAKQLAATQGFLLSGEDRFRQDWSEARAEEETALNELRPLVESMSLQVQLEFARFFPLTFDWYRDHETAFSQTIFPTDSLEGPSGQDHLEWLDAEQALYDEVLSVSRTLKASLASARPMAEGLRVDSLEGAESLVDRVLGAQARQRTALQSFLLTVDTRFRDRYAEAAGEEEFLMGTLRPLGAALSAPIRNHSQRFDSLSSTWHQGLEEKLSLEAVPQDPPPAQQEVAFLQQMDKEQASYDEILLASSALKVALRAEMEAGEAEMERVREIQTQLTQGLGLLGLLATGVVLLLGWNLRRLMKESEARRQEALRARREADAILGATGDGVVGIDRQGQCVFMNRAGAELLGYSTRLAAGRDIHELLHHSHPDGRCS